MDRELFFHVGLPKAGSTTIQSALWPNARALRREGIEVVLHTGDVARSPDLDAMVEPDPAIAANLRGLLKHTLRKTPSARRLVISEENYTAYLMPHRSEGRHADRTRAIVETLLQACEGLGLELRIVVYLRRQDLWLASCYAECILVGDALTLEDYRSRYAVDGLDWQGLVEAYRSLLPAQSLIVRRLDPAGVSGAGLVADFGRIIGSEYLLQDPPHARVGNVGYGRSMLEIARLALPHLTEHEKRVFVDVFQSFDSKGMGPGEGSPGRLDTEDRQQLLARFEAGNRWVAREVFGEDRLFAAVGERESEPYPGLQLETACVLLARGIVAVRQQQHQGLMILRLLAKIERRVQAWAKRHPRARGILRGCISRLGLLTPAEHGGGNQGDWKL